MKWWRRLRRGSWGRRQRLGPVEVYFGASAWATPLPYLALNLCEQNVTLSLMVGNGVTDPLGTVELTVRVPGAIADALDRLLPDHL